MPNFTADLIPAMVTPFARDESVDYERVEQLAGYLVDGGCDGLLVNGTTGEAPTLTLDEKLELVKVVKNAVRNKRVDGTGATARGPVPIITGVGGNDTRKTVEEARKMAAAGVDALLVVVPYYNKPGQRGMMEHFRRVAQAVDVEIVIYNIPSRCVVLMSPDTMAALHAECPNIIGVKQSCPDMDQVSEISAKLPADTWLTWCGDDSMTLPMMACGAHGVVSVAAHLTAPLMREMIDAAKADQRDKALKLHLRQLHLMRELFFLPNPTVVKTCLAKLGMMDLVFRSPMVPPDDTEMPRIDQLLTHYKTLNLHQPQALV